MRLARPLEDLIDQLLKLPTIGPKTAQRLALFILKMPAQEARQLAQSIIDAQEKVFPCPICGFFTDQDPCLICQDQDRESQLLCVVAESSDIIALERSGYRGKYHVLNQSPSLDELDLGALDLTPFIKRLQAEDTKEVILALNPDMDGEILSRFLAAAITQLKIKVTRLAHGLPVGGDIEFADEITLRMAIDGRKEL
ncbi:Recombination protein RecR, C4-type zinc finger [Syntrophomonas zehnderi OL-4]|uniref:Recombination protein RecR n=1 Tax=Syntrophomonas zehnderi OL-4 TaxID=690567 RepID=A0A0E4C844_9FIRM|nr:recombination mediator RecR [Syntrophomonas zehnderi]CFX23350.1 Recombination protein RecR, C4-type zinc finger [Syntrophomonas zehnderi OL-4]